MAEECSEECFFKKCLLFTREQTFSVGSVLPVERLASCHQNVNFKWYFVCYTDPWIIMLIIGQYRTCGRNVEKIPLKILCDY